jgi:hypothetical protein
MMLNSLARMTTEPVLITDTVAEITVAPARSFRQWAIDQAGEFQGRRAQ